MSNMRQLLESIDKFAGEPEQKRGDQVRGTDNPKKSGKKHGFANRLVGEDLELFKELMLEYKMFEVGNLAQNQDGTDQPNSPVAQINPAGAGTAPANTNPALQAQDDQKQNSLSSKENQPGQPGQPTAPGQQTNSQQAALALKQKSDLTKNITGLKSIDPTLNIQKTVNAIEKDPQHTTAADAEHLAHVVNAIEPMLKNNQAAQGLTSNLKRMMAKGQQ